MIPINEQIEKTMSTELEMFENWYFKRISPSRSLSSFPVTDFERGDTHMHNYRDAWLARAELAKQDNQVIAELVGAIEYLVLSDREISRLTVLKKHADRIKQAKEGL